MHGIASARVWAGEVTLPLLIVHGGEDTLCRVDGSEWLMRHVGSRDKELRVVPGCKHEVLFEKEGGEIVSFVAAWLRRQTGGEVPITV